MVGVAGRSKGCNTCRKRRVKCGSSINYKSRLPNSNQLTPPDETKPVCLRCTKAGFECAGYERPRIWHHTSTAPFPTPEALEKQPLVTCCKPAGDRVSSPPPELSLVAFQGDFCISFMFANFIWRSYGTLWLNQAAEGKLGKLALDATKALSQANFGSTNHKTDIELKGSMQYGQCLKTLATELGKGMALVKGGNQLLVPILILMMHAVSSCVRTNRRPADIRRRQSRIAREPSST